MDRRKIKKITGPKYYLLLIGIVFLILSLLSSIGMKGIAEEKEPYSYASIANTQYDVAGEYVYLEIIDLYQFAIRETATANEEYYYAFDKDMYLYVVCISDKKFDELEQLYLKDPDNFSYRLEGYLYNLDGEVRHFAQNMIVEVFGEELSYLADEFDEYFLSTYLDTLNSPAITAGEVVIVSIIFFVIGCAVFTMGVLRVLKVGKLKQSKEYSEIISELEDPAVRNIDSMKLSLTKSYLFYYGKKLGFVNYRDIKDLIHDKNRLCVKTEAETLDVGICSSELYQDIKSFVDKKKNVFNINEA